MGWLWRLWSGWSRAASLNLARDRCRRRRARGLVLTAGAVAAMLRRVCCRTRRGDLRRGSRGRTGCFAHPGDMLADEFLDRGDGLYVIATGDKSDRGAGLAGASGAPDAVHVIIRVMRNVEIIDVTDLGDIETAR